MSDVNVFTLSGRLGADVSFRTMPSGSDIAVFRIASEDFNGMVNGEPTFRVLWMDCEWDDKRAMSLAGSLTRGRWLTVVGKLRSFETEEGRRKGLPPKNFIEVHDVTFPPRPRAVAPAHVAGPSALNRQAPSRAPRPASPSRQQDDEPPPFNY